MLAISKNEAMMSTSGAPQKIPKYDNQKDEDGADNDVAAVSALLALAGASSQPEPQLMNSPFRPEFMSPQVLSQHQAAAQAQAAAMASYVASLPPALRMNYAYMPHHIATMGRQAAMKPLERGESGPRVAEVTPHPAAIAAGQRMLAVEHNELLDMSTTEFNRYLKRCQLDPNQIAELRKERRRKKNRLYAKRSRGKKLQRQLDDSLKEGKAVKSTKFRRIQIPELNSARGSGESQGEGDSDQGDDENEGGGELEHEIEGRGEGDGDSDGSNAYAF